MVLLCAVQCGALLPSPDPNSSLRSPNSQTLPLVCRTLHCWVPPTHPHATHYCHMHTSRGCVCLGAWGYRGMCAVIAISRLCQEESLKGLQDHRHSTPFDYA